MNKTLCATALAFGLISATPAAADNEMILLNPDDLSNLAVLTIAGNHNRLVIDQVHPGQGKVNAIAISFTGDNNGGPEGSVFTNAASRSSLQPGQMIQKGFGNEVTMTVKGNNNLFAVAQLGNSNTVRGTMIGTANQAAVMQTGQNNFASFSQTGIGNIINVRQTSW